MALPDEIEAAGAPTWCSSATCSRPWSAAASVTPQRRGRAVLRRLDEVPWWAAPVAHPPVQRGSGDALRRRGRCSASHPTLLLRGPEPAGARLDRRRGAAYRQARGRRSPISARPRPRCASCIAPASATTISPRSRTGCAAPTGAPTSPISSSPHPSGPQPLFRVAAYEDLRHLLKHKRRYAPEALTAAERACWRRRACRPVSGWRPASRSTTDHARHSSASSTARAAGRGWCTMRRSIAARLKTHPQVRDAAVVAYPGPARRHRALCVRRGAGRLARARTASDFVAADPSA